MTLATVGKPSPRSGANKAGPGPAPGSFQRLHQSVPGTQRPSDAGQANTIGFFNSFFGLNAGQSNTTERENTFIGHLAGSNNGTNDASNNANFNTFVGSRAGLSNTTVGFNSFFGGNAGNSNNTGN